MAGPNFWGYTTRPAQTFGSRLGGDFADVLQSLAADKAHQVKTNQNKRFLQSLNIRPDIAAALAPQSEENIFKFLNNFEGFDIGNQAQAYPQNNQQQMAGFTPGMQTNQPNQPEQAPNMPQRQPSDVPGMVKQLYTDYPQLRGQISPEQLGQLIQNQSAQQALHPQASPAPATTGIKTKAAAEAERKARIEQLKEAHDINKINIKEEQEARKESKKYLAQLNKDSKVAKENDMKLDRMLELIDTGKLSSPLFHNSLKTLAHGLWGVGIDLHHLESPESQEFSKLSNDMVKGIKDIFGARVTNLDVESFLKTIPTLSQSNEGKTRIIRNLKISNQANKLKENTAKKIIKENGNLIPADLELLVEEKVNPQLDALAEKFVKNAEPNKKVTKTEEPIDTIFKGTGLNKLSLLQ